MRSLHAQEHERSCNHPMVWMAEWRLVAKCQLCRAASTKPSDTVIRSHHPCYFPTRTPRNDSLPGEDEHADCIHSTRASHQVQWCEGRSWERPSRGWVGVSGRVGVAVLPLLCCLWLGTGQGSAGQTVSLSLVRSLDPSCLEIDPCQLFSASHIP